VSRGDSEREKRKERWRGEMERGRKREHRIRTGDAERRKKRMAVAMRRADNGKASSEMWEGWWRKRNSTTSV
jgi:hypothetical protein